MICLLEDCFIDLFIYLPTEGKTFTQDATVALPLEERGCVFPENDPEIHG